MGYVVCFIFLIYVFPQCACTQISIANLIKTKQIQKYTSGSTPVEIMLKFACFASLNMLFPVVSMACLPKPKLENFEIFYSSKRFVWRCFSGTFTQKYFHFFLFITAAESLMGVWLETAFLLRVVYIKMLIAIKQVGTLAKRTMRNWSLLTKHRVSENDIQLIKSSNTLTAFVF